MHIFFPKEKVKQGEGLDLCMAVATYYCICVLLLRYETRRTVLETCRATQQVVISLSSSAALQHPRVCGRCNLGAGLREPSVLGYVAADPDGPRGPSTMSVNWRRVLLGLVLTSQIKEEHFTLVPERNQALQRFSWIREHFPIEAPRSKLESDAAK
jgi:hypothetical protein